MTPLIVEGETEIDGAFAYLTITTPLAPVAPDELAPLWPSPPVPKPRVGEVKAQPLTP
jgi:hypothetical protein